MKIRNVNPFLLLLLTGVLFTNCSDDESMNPKAGKLILRITDAASDDSEIQGIYLNISQVKVNGKPIRNYTPQHLDIASLRNGETEILAEKELPAREYQNISLVLSASGGNAGDSPGCFVLTQNNIRHNLMADDLHEIEIVLSKNFLLEPGEETELVLDFDLRKAIIRNDMGESRYRFVTTEELRNAVRVMDMAMTGSISGTVKAGYLDDYIIYVLLYNEGTFKAATEGTGAGKSKILFSNAVSIAKVEPDDSYMLSFIEHGEYDIRLAAYKKNNMNVFSFYGFLPTTSRKTGILLNNILVSPGAELELDIEVFRLL